MPAVIDEGRLHILLQPSFEEVYEPDILLDPPLVRFVAYTATHRLFGWVQLEADRLTDMLNACDEVLLEEVEIAAMATGPSRFEEVAMIPRSELLAVHAGGPRGNEDRRVETVAWPVEVRSGSLRVAGHLNVPRGAEPLEDLRTRPPMIPLTGAWLERREPAAPAASLVGRTGAEPSQRSGRGTIIVNRDLADSIRIVSEADLA